MTDQDHTHHAQVTAATPAAGDASSAAVPESTPQAGNREIEIIATGLHYPRGFTWGPDGALYVALAGDGLTTPPGSELQAAARPEAPPSVVRIVNGEAFRWCRIAVYAGSLR